MENKKNLDVNLRTSTLRKHVLDKLVERGVTILDVAKITFEMQKDYSENLTLELCELAVLEVLKKREILNAFAVGIELDELAEKRLLSEPLQTLIETDEGLFGVDETIALGGCYAYGSIAVTTFGHLDKQKVGIIKDLDTKGSEKVNTFLDDLIGMLAANASARVAHRERDELEWYLNEVDGLNQEN